MKELKGKQLQEAIEQALSKQRSGLSYPEIRQELSALSVPNDQITYIINKVDAQVLAEAAHRDDGKRTLLHMVVGGILCLIGVVITVTTYFLPVSNHRIYLISFIPFIGGYLLFRRAFHRYRNLDGPD